jgi:hypothetical protein
MRERGMCGSGLYTLPPLPFPSIHRLSQRKSLVTDILMQLVAGERNSKHPPANILMTLLQQPAIDSFVLDPMWSFNALPRHGPCIPSSETARLRRVLPSRRHATSIERLPPATVDLPNNPKSEGATSLTAVKHASES